MIFNSFMDFLLWESEDNLQLCGAGTLPDNRDIVKDGLQCLYVPA